VHLPAIRCPRRTKTIWLVIGALALITSACSTKDKATVEPHASSTAPSSTGTTAPGRSPTPRATPAEAVQALLTAERRGDHATSYRLLSPQGLARYNELFKWKKRRSEVPPITSFTIRTSNAGPGKSTSNTVVVEVRHKPGLDPFIGLSAARELERWNVHHQGSGWLVDADPSVTYLLPSDAKAASAAEQWARTVQSCDERRATALQAVDELYGTSAVAARLCRSKGTVTAGKVGRLEAGPSSSDLIAQYSTDALSWARVVRISARSGSFGLVMAPLGQVWKPLGLSD
jgi:hypothetical protein